MTGGRLKRVGPYLKGGDSLCITYRDGVADIDGGQISHEWVPLERLAGYQRLPMDTLGGKGVLEALCRHESPWKRWA